MWFGDGKAGGRENRVNVTARREKIRAYMWIVAVGKIKNKLTGKHCYI